jgi:hypothetical protein
MRRSDELARRRQALPWVPIEKGYVFETNNGRKTLAELFDRRSQLLVYHFMFGFGFRVDEDNPGCAGCSFVADHFDGAVPHLNGRDETLVAESMPPLEELRPYKARMGWRFPWVSSLGSDLRYDFGAAFTEEQQRNGGELIGDGASVSEDSRAAGTVGGHPPGMPLLQTRPAATSPSSSYGDPAVSGQRAGFSLRDKVLCHAVEEGRPPFPGAFVLLGRHAPVLLKVHLGPAVSQIREHDDDQLPFLVTGLIGDREDEPFGLDHLPEGALPADLSAVGAGEHRGSPRAPLGDVHRDG